MKRADREGNTLAYCRSDGCPIVLRVDQYPHLLAAWKAGQAFYDGVGVYGELVSIRLAGIEAVALLDANTCSEVLADEEEDRKGRLLRGEE